MFKPLKHRTYWKYGTFVHNEAKGGGIVSDYQPLEEVNVHSEDGELKEVISGRVDDFRLTAYNPIYDFVGGHLLPLFKEHPNELFSDADPEWFSSSRIVESSCTGLARTPRPSLPISTMKAR
jgi:hypothetical protein